jgi:hypothetical protein
MKKNKYDLVEDIAWMLHEMKNCKGCFMKNECPWQQKPDEEKVLCANVTELTEAIENKYLR